MGTKLQKIYITYSNSLKKQGLWQAHYQILTIIFLKKFIKLNINTDTMIKNMKLVELHTNYVAVFLNTQTLNIQQNKMFML